MRPWAFAEERAARALGGRRVKRERFESAPDIEGIPGLVVEVKSRKRLPGLVVKALEQASRYRVLEETPVAALFERGSRRGIACLWLSDFAELVEAASPERRAGRPQEALAGSPDPSPSPSPDRPGLPPCSCTVCLAEGRHLPNQEAAPSGAPRKEST